MDQGGVVLGQEHEDTLGTTRVGKGLEHTNPMLISKRLFGGKRNKKFCDRLG